MLYYVSPYVAGGSLRERITREGRLPIAEVTRIAYEVGTALDYAHRNGFVHRDVKPENILFADGQAVLADFGVARALGFSLVDAVTEVGMAVGTPACMSPEQASGDSDIGSASDVYSLACVVYESAGGRATADGVDGARASDASSDGDAASHPCDSTGGFVEHRAGADSRTSQAAGGPHDHIAGRRTQEHRDR